MLLVAVAACIVLVVGCAGVGSTGRDVRVFRARGEAIMEEEAGPADVLRGGESYLRAAAEALPAAGASEPFQRRLTALEAAKYRALAKLVEGLEGVRVERETSIRDLQFQQESVVARAVGNLTGATVVESAFDEETGVGRVTVQVVLDAEGNTVVPQFVPPSAVSRQARRARAEQAARVDAMAKLREKIGKVRVGQEVHVENLMLRRHEAWLVVEGWLQGVEFSPPEWVGERRCVVEVAVRVPEAELARLSSLSGGG
jgi:hypothetical protein